MNCYIYKSDRKTDHYLYLPEKLETLELPQALTNLLGDLLPVMELDLQVDTKLANADAETVISAIKTDQFYLQMPQLDQPHPFDQ